MQTTIKHYDTLNSKSVMDFWTHLTQEVYPNAPKIHIILDNGRYFKNKEINQFLKDNPRLQVHYLPPYSPNLNPIERLWKVFHEYVSNNKYYSTGKEFKDSVLEFFNQTLPNIADFLKKKINDHFHLLNNVSSI